MSYNVTGKSSIFAFVFFVSTSLLGNERQKDYIYIYNLDPKALETFRIFIYRKWPNDTKYGKKKTVIN